jgi:predicted nucleic acid-binding protein
VSFLLDTNVISETRKATPNPNVIRWMNSVPGPEVFLSVLVVGEIRQGIERLRRHDPVQFSALDNWLTTLRVEFADRTLPVTTEIAEEWRGSTCRTRFPPWTASSPQPPR